MFLKAMLALAFTPLFAAELTVHEWGTFTSVADEAGDAVRWVSLRPPADLPCFVYHLGAQCVKCAASRVRMETPVLYFYSLQPLAASVHVSLPSGVVSEWYPAASGALGGSTESGITYGNAGKIAWDRVEVSPGSTPAFPTTAEPSHYYAARETDAAPLRVAGQSEKMLFYRGIADFDVPLAPKFLPDGELEVRNTGSDPIAFALVFENRSGKIGFQVIRNLTGSALLDSSEVARDAAAVYEELRTALIAAGLYSKEAAAMIETWRDSWFEEGMRIFYLVPRKTVDAVLPLRIDPAPASLERVFVGRVDVLSPALRRALQTALAKGDTATLARYGRFVRPFCDQILHQPERVQVAPAAAAFLARADQAKPPNPAPCRTEAPPLVTDQR
jgi:hypothetical protein